MRILLLQPKTNWVKNYCESPSIALLTLGAIAKQYGHYVDVYHMDIDPIDVAQEVKTVDLVGISTNTFQVKSARAVAKTVREASHARIVVGGPHAIAWDGEADDVVVGEGENKWLKILGETKEYTDIDDIPLPDYSMVDMHRFSGVSPIGAVPSTVLFASRGCPGKCIFCNSPSFWGSKVRYRKPKKVVDQIEMLHRKYGMREVFIQDDTFNANWPWAKEILEGIISRGLNKEMVFKIDCRGNQRMVTEEFLDLAKEAGVWNIFIGVESGSQKMLDRMKKHVTVEEYKRAIRLIQDRGMKVQASFIIGLPGENWDTIQETQRFIDETNPWTLGCGFATPFPGTEFDKYVTEHNQKLLVDYADYVYGKPIVRTDEVDYDDLALFRLYKTMYIKEAVHA